MKNKLTNSLFSEPEKPKLSDKIKLEKPEKKVIEIAEIKEVLPSRIFVENISALTEDQRKQLFPVNPPLTLRQLKQLKRIKNERCFKGNIIQ